MAVRARGGLVRAFARRSWAERGAAIEALGLLAAARVAILVVPFRWIAPRLGRRTAVTGQSWSGRQGEAAARVEWAVAAAASRAPWRSACLARAIAATLMLRRRGVPSTLYLGVSRPDGGGAMQAHAWVRCGTRVVTGAAEAGRFQAIATFASQPRPRPERRG